MSDIIPENERSTAARFFATRNLQGELPLNSDDVYRSWVKHRDKLIEDGTPEELLDEELRTWQSRVGDGGDDHVRRVWAVFMGRLDAETASMEVASAPVKEHAIYDRQRSSVPAQSVGSSGPVTVSSKVLSATNPPRPKRHKPARRSRSS